jgi:hypothetical protein
VLAARTRGAKRVDAQIGGIDVDFDGLVDFGIHEHARERRVAAGVRIEGARADEAMHARFGAQMAVSIIAGHLDAGALDAGDFALGLLEDLGCVTLALAVAQVHPQQHRRPVLRFGAAATGLNIDETRVGVHRIVEHPTEFHFGDDAIQALHIDLESMQRVIVRFGARQREQFTRILEVLVEARERLHDALELLFFPAQRLRPLLIGPDFRILQVARYRAQALRLCLEVKDTSADRQRAAAIRLKCWQSD